MSPCPQLHSPNSSQHIAPVIPLKPLFFQSWIPFSVCLILSLNIVLDSVDLYATFNTIVHHIRINRMCASGFWGFGFSGSSSSGFSWAQYIRFCRHSSSADVFTVIQWVGEVLLHCLPADRCRQQTTSCKVVVLQWTLMTMGCHLLDHLESSHSPMYADCWGVKIFCFIFSRNKLNSTVDNGHPCYTPTAVQRKSLTLQFIQQNSI